LEELLEVVPLLTLLDGELAFTFELPLELELETRDLEEATGFELEALELVRGLSALWIVCVLVEELLLVLGTELTTFLEDELCRELLLGFTADEELEVSLDCVFTDGLLEFLITELELVRVGALRVEVTPLIELDV